MDELITSLIDDLKTELEVTDENFNLSLLEVKVKNAVKEVEKTRNYPSTYDDAKKIVDLNNYYSQMRKIALYDYNLVGGEFQLTLSENGTSRKWVDRESLFNGILSIARL